MIIDAITAEPWAITHEGLEQIVAIAQRLGDPEALEAKLGVPLQNTHAVTIRHGVATLPTIGPIFQRANILTRVSGATSNEIVARDFTQALNNPAVTSIVLNVDSPGGQLGGTSELADMIFAAREIKPITAYIPAAAQSAALWIASAASRVVAQRTAMMGSVGVVMAVRTREDKDRVEIVSS